MWQERGEFPCINKTTKITYLPQKKPRSNVTWKTFQKFVLEFLITFIFFSRLFYSPVVGRRHVKMFPERSEKSGMDFQNCFPGNYGYRKIHFAEKSFRLNKTCPNQKFAETEACFFLNLITNQKYLNDGFERMFLGSLLKKSNSEGSFQITLYHDSPAMHTHSKS